MHWSLAIAKDIVEHRSEKRHVVATGITPSGAIHVGNLREIIIGDAVHSALLDMSGDAKLIYVADTFDPLRRRYPFLPADYEEYVGKVLSEIPDPDGCHSSYADHFLMPFLDSLAILDINIEVFRADKMYKSGMYVDVIKEAFLRRDDLAKIIEDVSGRVVTDDWMPFNPLCEACGRITSATVSGYDLDKEVVYYECDCGNKGVASFKGDGKLPWRVDWAARWKILGVTIEPFGKDHAAPGGSYDSGKRIAPEIFQYAAPYPIPFEHIHLKVSGGEGMKAKITTMSSSKGTNIPVHEIVEAVPPEILKHVIARVRPDKHIEFNPSLPLLNLIDEYERERGGIGRGIAKDIPFRHLLTLVQIARGDFPHLIEIIKRSGYALHEQEQEQEQELRDIREKVRYAENWLRTYAPPHVKFEVQSVLPADDVKSLTEEQKKALALMAEDLGGGISLNAMEWHNKIYDVATTTQIDPKNLFKAIYIVLLKKTSGPRAGWLLASLETDFLRERFDSAAKM
jgi:lysyl-tRNA synthetase class 1